MPGIVGLITKRPGAQAEPELLRMVEALRHESFYVTGTWTDEEAGIYVGWAVREKSFSDCVPILNERGDLALIFSGEEYPDSDTVQGLKQRGHTIGSGGASYLVH